MSKSFNDLISKVTECDIRNSTTRPRCPARNAAFHRKTAGGVFAGRPYAADAGDVWFAANTRAQDSRGVGGVGGVAPTYEATGRRRMRRSSPSLRVSAACRQ